MTDPFLWLEDVTADTSLDWVRERNARTIGEYAEPEVPGCTGSVCLSTGSFGF